MCMREFSDISVLYTIRFYEIANVVEIVILRTDFTFPFSFIMLAWAKDRFESTYL